MCQDSRNGPDWTDVLTYADQLQQFHRCACTVALQPGTTSVSYRWRVIVMLTASTPRGHLGSTSVCAECDWPTHMHKTLTGAVMAAMYALDHKATEHFWEQTKLA